MSFPYSLPQKEKAKLLFDTLMQLTAHHAARCPEYARILDLFYPKYATAACLPEIPYLPVNLFKTNDLMSIPSDEIFKVLKSSGTTSSKPSKIFLDAATAQRQTRALADIMISFLGDQRLPLLVIDNPNVIKDLRSYSARGAALVGMMTFGRDVCYALDDDMNLNHEAVDSWLQKHQNTPILLFGMTYIIWKHFLAQIAPVKIPQGILFHTGGWKKLEDISVCNESFKEKLAEMTQIRKCHNFYGMVEQVGSVYVECSQGHLHSPEFSDIIIRDPVHWNETDGEGVIQVLSSLPTSYPGHSLLTEDLGRVIGIDNCPCGRLGKFFKVIGRVPQAEIRGCSDTYAVEGS